MVSLPKTKNAFALRDISEGRISSLDYLLLCTPIVEEDLDFLKMFDYPFVAPLHKGNGLSAEIVAIEEMVDIASKKLARLDAHILQLRKYLEMIVNKLISGNANDAVRERAARSKKFLEEYDSIKNAVAGYKTFWEESLKERRDLLPAEFKKDFGGRLKQAREKANLSLKRVAQSLDLTYTGYVQYERGLREPPLWTIKRLAELYNVSTDWLFGLKF